MIDYKGIQLGPLMKEDAAVLQALIRATNPKTLIEFGHLLGESAKVMLEAMDSDAVLHSYDPTQDSSISDEPRFIFHKQSQTEISGIENIDFVFLDASHEYDLNMETFLKIKDNLSPKAIIIVHDTGSWAGGNVFDITWGHPDGNGCWVHRPDEQLFVDWIKKAYPEFQQIHLHSVQQVRHGMTILQRYHKLK